MITSLISRWRARRICAYVCRWYTCHILVLSYLVLSSHTFTYIPNELDRNSRLLTLISNQICDIRADTSSATVSVQWYSNTPVVTNYKLIRNMMNINPTEGNQSSLFSYPEYEWFRVVFLPIKRFPVFIFTSATAIQLYRHKLNLVFRAKKGIKFPRKQVAGYRYRPAISDQRMVYIN